MEQLLLDLIKELEFCKDDEKPQDEGYNLGINTGINAIKKRLRKLASDKNGIDLEGKCVDEKVEKFSKLLNNSLINEAIAND